MFLMFLVVENYLFQNGIILCYYEQVYIKAAVLFFCRAFYICRTIFLNEKCLFKTKLFFSS